MYAPRLHHHIVVLSGLVARWARQLLLDNFLVAWARLTLVKLSAGYFMRRVGEELLLNDQSKLAKVSLHLCYARLLASLLRRILSLAHHSIFSTILRCRACFVYMRRVEISLRFTDQPTDELLSLVEGLRTGVQERAAYIDLILTHVLFDD